MHRVRSMRSIVVAVAVFVTVGLVLGSSAVWATTRRATGPAQPPVQSVPPVAVAAQQSAEALPPVLVSSDPADGATWDGGPVTLVFDQPLAPGTDTQVSVSPALDGEVTVTDTKVVFTPSAAPEPGVRYTLRVPAEATSADGTPLGTAVEVSIVAATPPTVTSTQPSDGATEVDTAGQIVVVFNRPVVALDRRG